MADLADDGRARVRQDPGRGGMDRRTGHGPTGFAHCPGRRVDGRGAQHHGRRRERIPADRGLPRRPGGVGAEPGPPEMAQRQRGADFSRATVPRACAGRNTTLRGATSWRNGAMPTRGLRHLDAARDAAEVAGDDDAAAVAGAGADPGAAADGDDAGTIHRQAQARGRASSSARRRPANGRARRTRLRP